MQCSIPVSSEAKQRFLRPGRHILSLLSVLIFESAVVAEGLKLGVYGHTDNSGSDVVNLPLSTKRAGAVKAYLVKKGLKEVQVESKGFGSAKPVADNSSEAGRSKNRRVEIVLGE